MTQSANSEEKNVKIEKVLVIGAGMAGSDCAFSLAEAGIKVVLIECKKNNPNPSHKLPTFAELVCTNSLKSKNEDSAHGQLKYEMDKLGSVILKKARENAVGAGDALAVNRKLFSEAITSTLSDHPMIEVIHSEVSDPQEEMKKHDCQIVVIASGPLTTTPLEKWIMDNISKDDFYFYDAIAPVVDGDSLDYSKLYFKDRHKEVEEGKAGSDSADYLNIPLNKEEYESFIFELKNARKTPAKEFEEYKFFESCLPIDIMAERGPETARFSCMKPIGLEQEDGKRPYACVQLRKENLLGDAYNMVGFQTRLTYPEQKRVFSMLPGMQDVSFVHLGSVHRNSFLNAKKLLNFDLSSKEFSHIYFAGQITGVEGYTESAAMGLYVAEQIKLRRQNKEAKKWPVEMTVGALVNYIMTISKPVPSNINFGLLPSVAFSPKGKKRSERKKLKKQLACERARQVSDEFLS